MTTLTPIQHFFRYFSYSQAIVAAIMILGGLWLRLTTGWHAASFLFFVWGLSCVYMSIACLFAWRNWFLEGKPDPVLEKKRRKSMVTYIALGGLIWLFFGYAIAISAVRYEITRELVIVKSSQFDKELNRFVIASKRFGYSPVLKYTESELVLGHNTNRAFVAFSLIKPFSEGRTVDSHIHQVKVDGAEFDMVLRSHQFRFGWKKGTMRGGSGGRCLYHIPVELKVRGIGEILEEPTGGRALEFTTRPELNKLNITLVDGELVVSDFLDQNDVVGANYCSEAVVDMRYNPNTTSGIMALDNAPIDMVRYLAFPGLYDGTVRMESKQGYGLVNDLSSYLKRVGIVS